MTSIVPGGSSHAASSSLISESASRRCTSCGSDYQAALVAREEQRPVDSELIAQVRSTVSVPRDLDFRKFARP